MTPDSELRRDLARVCVFALVVGCVIVGARIVQGLRKDRTSPTTTEAQHGLS